MYRSSDQTKPDQIAKTTIQTNPNCMYFQAKSIQTIFYIQFEPKVSNHGRVQCLITAVREASGGWLAAATCLLISIAALIKMLDQWNMHACMWIVKLATHSQLIHHTYNKWIHYAHQCVTGSLKPP